MLYLRPIAWAIIFATLFLIYRTLATPVRGLDDGEAWMMWITHDNTPIIGAPIDMFRAMRANLGDMYAIWRDSPSPPLYIFLLDVWRMLTGANMMTSRWLSSLLALLGMAITLRIAYQMRFEGKWSDVVFIGLLFAYPAATIGAESLIIVWCALGLWGYTAYRLTRKRRYQRLGLFCLIASVMSVTVWHINMFMALLTPVVALFTLRIMHLKPDDTIHMSYNPIITTTALFFICSFIVYQFLVVWVRQDWQTIIQTHSAERSLTEPIVIIYPPYHPLAYYDRTESIRFGRGAVLNLGWRAFDEAELTRVADALKHNDTFWMVAPNGERHSEVLARLLHSSHHRVFLGNVNRIMSQRFSRR